MYENVQNDPTGTSAQRHDWLEESLLRLKHMFSEKGHTVPEATRVSIGWPRGGGSGHTIGQCFYALGSADEHNEIFISPELGNNKDAVKGGWLYGFEDGRPMPQEIATAIRIMDVLAHECIHAILGLEGGHKRPFKMIANEIGLAGKMTATIAGPEFIKWSANEILTLGPYPAGRLAYSPMKKQTTRMRKCTCGECGFLVRTTQKWLTDVGAPRCAVVEHGAMEIEAGDGDD